MSEAELHMLHSRLRGGILNQARRGALRTPLPVGLVYDPLGNVALDPDEQVRHSLRLLFDTFERTGSARQTVKYFLEEDLRFPVRLRTGPRKGELHWQPLRTSRTLGVLHNPRYAGAFAFGRTRHRRLPGGGKQVEHLVRGEWTALLVDAHPGYISWERFEANQRQLAGNARAYGKDRSTPPREGPALLQGLAICGVCGRRMTVRYHTRKGRRGADYLCYHESADMGKRGCQDIAGAGIDRAVGALLVELMTPVTLDVALQVQAELDTRAGDADRWRAQQVQRAREDADLARQRYMQTQPGNRMVADVLEAEWNAKLRALDEAQQELERGRKEPGQALDEQQRQRILALAADFPRLWNDPETPHRERKRMARLLIEDVTLTKGTDEWTVGVRLRGGATRTLSVPPALPSWKLYETPRETVAEIDRLLDDHIESEIPAMLNEGGFRSGHGLDFDVERVRSVRRSYGLKTYRERLRARGLLDVRETAARLGVTAGTVTIWRNRGLLRGYFYNTKCCLYDPDASPKHLKWNRGAV